MGTEIETVDGLGVVAGIDVFSDTVKVRLPERHTLLTYALGRSKYVDKKNYLMPLMAFHKI